MRDWASELRAIADGRLLLNVRNGVTVSRSMLAMIADEIDALRAAPLTPAEVGGHADAQTEARAIPEFIRPWTAPFHVTMDGIKDAKGCWVCSATNNKLAHQLVELMDYAATAATALAAKDAELAEVKAERDEHKRLKSALVLKAYRAMDSADDLVEALRRYGFPVSDAAETALMEGGSREAQALHKAAKAFIAARRALEGGTND